MARNFSSVCYCTNARRVHGILTERYDAALLETGLNAAQFCLLRNLERIGSGNLTQWAEATGIERTTMVRNAKKLAEDGYITEVDGRGKVYTLSDHGRRMMELALPIWNEMQKKIEAALGKDDSEALLRIGLKLQSI